MRVPWIQPTSVSNSPRLQGAYGPVAEYNRRVKSGVLRDDQHQRSKLSCNSSLNEGKLD